MPTTTTMPLSTSPVQARPRLLAWVNRMPMAAMTAPTAAKGIDPAVRDINDQYLFGPSLLVAPVTTFGATSRTVYLPAGTTWLDYYAGQRLQGGQTIEAAAPLERIPLYVRAGAIDLGPSAGFATLALNASYRVNAALLVSAGVDNLFDRTYSEHLNLAGSADFGFPADPVRINEPGRTAWLKVNYRY